MALSKSKDGRQEIAEGALWRSAIGVGEGEVGVE